MMAHDLRQGAVVNDQRMSRKLVEGHAPIHLTGRISFACQINIRTVVLSAACKNVGIAGDETSILTLEYPRSLPLSHNNV
jgi:hypothetical protein